MVAFRQWMERKRGDPDSGSSDFLSTSLDLASISSEQNITRSLSQRARNLGRRVSFMTKSNHSRCLDCHDVDFAQLSEKPINFQHNPDGIFLGWLPDGPPSGKCGLCQTLSQVRIQHQRAAVSPEELTGARLQVRAFPLLLHVSELFEQGSGFQSIPSNSSNADIFIAVVPNHFTMHPGSRNETLLSRLATRRGFLVYTDQYTSPRRLLNPHLVPPSFNPQTVKNWISTCQSSHPACRSDRRQEPSLNLIDCRTKTIVIASDIKEASCPEYVALSYVWGYAADQRKAVLDKRNLPACPPQVVQDSIDATLMLGYNYLWVDKYCVDKDDRLRKHEQLMHMDSVYQNATLTIVAAAGLDESYGLPGISKIRAAQQNLFDGEEFALTSILPLPHDSITKSRWASRGWTYQEAILSRRRLVFTHTQLYFECNSMSCCESFDLNQEDKVRTTGLNPLAFAQPSLFALKQLPSASTNTKAARLSNFFTYVTCTEDYSRRALSYDHDSLTAFSGIIRMLESFTAYPVRHIWGVPFFHPDDDNLSPQLIQSTLQSFRLTPFWKRSGAEYGVSPPRASANDESVDYLAFLLLGLSWRHESRSEHPRRRKDLPSWSWTGWKGAVTWPQLAQSTEVRMLHWTNSSISLGDSSTESVPTMYHNTTDSHLLTQSNKSLYIRTLSISPTAFILSKSPPTLALATGHSARLYPSKADLDAAKVLKRIHSMRYEVIVLATVDQDTYMMLVKKYRNSYYRIGTMAVNTAYLTTPLFTSDIKTYKLR